MIPTDTGFTDRRDPTTPDLRQLEREARQLRQAFAGDPSVRFVVGLDLLIRRAAIRLRQAWMALRGPAAAATPRGHASPT